MLDEVAAPCCWLWSVALGVLDIDPDVEDGCDDWSMLEPCWLPWTLVPVWLLVSVLFIVPDEVAPVWLPCML